MPVKFLQFILIPALIFSQFLPTSAMPFPVQASDWDLVGQAGGPSQGLAVQGNYAYMGVGPRLVIVDISDPTNPHPVGATAPFNYFVQGVAISGTYAYVAAGTAGLYVVDITSPNAPVQIGTWDSAGFAENITVVGNMAYLADGPDGLRVIDVSDPGRPTEIAGVFDMNYVVDVAVSGRYAYIAADGAGLLVAEISNPRYPIEAGAYDTPGYARGVAVTGSWVVLADENNGLVLLNIASPVHPALLGNLRFEGWAFDVSVSGSLVYVAAAFGGLQIINISNPAAPVVLGSKTWPHSNAAGIAAANGRIFIADRKSGLRAIDISRPAAPVEVGHWNAVSFAYSVEMDDHYAYLAAGFNGVRIFSLSDPTRPVEVGAFLADGLFQTIKRSGNRLFAGTFIGSPQNGLYALDISNPIQPKQIGYYSDVVECWGIEVVGDMVYVADANSLKIFDFSNPPTFKLLGEYSTSAPRGLTVRGGFAFTTHEFNGLRIYDVSNPAAIHLAGSFQGANSFSRGPVGLSGNYAYITEVWGLRVLNISNLAAPSEVSYTAMQAENNWLAMNDSGDRIYVSEGSYGFSVFDVSNPSAPKLIDQTAALGAVQALDLAGDQMAVASGEGGLQIFTATASNAQLQTFRPSQFQQQVHALPIPPPVHRVGMNFAPLIEKPLAPDRLAGVCVVTSTANTGPGTLRNCLQNQVSGDVITFSPVVFPPTAPNTIHIGPERLPFLVQDRITIDASNAGVILDGSVVSGLWDTGIGIFSNNNIVQGLQVVNFPLGIAVMGDNNLIGGSRLAGSSPTGQGNLVSGNRQDGIVIHLGAEGNIVLGNIVGLDVTGTQAYPNQWCGISINQAPHNTIGSLNPGEGNIVSANQGDGGILLYGYATIGNKIIGNMVGTDITGTQGFGNQGVGVYIESGSFNTLLQGNLISANERAEVFVSDFETDFNSLIGNSIGTNLAGDAPLPNLASTGIGLGFVDFTRIGGTAPGEGNVVANPGGVSVVAPFGAHTRIAGNHIGVNAAGTATLAGGGGISLSGATRTLVGGTTPEEANYVTTSRHFSVDVRSMDNVIASNFMGLAVDGVTPLDAAGFQVLSLRDGNIIQGNHIANSTSAGIWLDGAQANTIRRNSIWANPFKGIFLDKNANANLPAPTISLNAFGGSGATCSGCTIELFLDAGSQGRFYLDSMVANGSGTFSFPAYCPLPYPNLTATVTDPQGNTSPFSNPSAVPWDCIGPRPAPKLANLDPTNQPALAGTFRLTLTGTGFYADSVVRWNGTALPATVISSTHAQADIPSYLFQDGGDFPVMVFTPTPGGGESGTLIVHVAPPRKIYLPMVRR